MVFRHLVLGQPLVVFDLETTGADIVRDRIVEIALIRVEADGSQRSFASLVNPEMPIPSEATRVHGISDDDVRDQPTLRALAPQIVDLFAGADLAGYNSIRFDWPLLTADLARAGVTIASEGRRHLDACRIFHEKERRDLAAALRFYVGRELEGAHRALADTEATLAILDAQIGHYEDLPRDVDGLHRFCNKDEGRWLDTGRRLAWNESGEVVLAFGQHRGIALRRIAAEKPDYLQWIIKADFAEDVKRVAGEALKGRFPERSQKLGQEAS